MAPTATPTTATPTTPASTPGLNGQRPVPVRPPNPVPKKQENTDGRQGDLPTSPSTLNSTSEASNTADGGAMAGEPSTSLEGLNLAPDTSSASAGSDAGASADEGMGESTLELIETEGAAVEYQLTNADATTSNILTLSLLQCRDIGSEYNLGDYPMNSSEEETYATVLQTFLRAQPSLRVAAVTITDVSVSHQAAIREENDMCSTRQRSLAAMEDTNGVWMDVVTVIERHSQVLPSGVIDVLLTYLIEENKHVLIDLFHGASLAYFHGIVDISRRTVTEKPPHVQTQESSQTVAQGNKEESNDARPSFLLIGGVIGGVPWIVLALGCIACFMKARRKKHHAQAARDQNGSLTERASSDVNEGDVDTEVKEGESGMLLNFDVEEGIKAHAKFGVAAKGEEDSDSESEGEDTESDNKESGVKEGESGMLLKFDVEEGIKDHAKFGVAAKGEEGSDSESEGEDTESDNKESGTESENDESQIVPLVYSPGGNATKRCFSHPDKSDQLFFYHQHYCFVTHCFTGARMWQHWLHPDQMCWR